jgi:hypothetical protein
LIYDFYLLGPMSGYIDNNHPLFNHWAKRLRDEHGATVCNPAELDARYGKPEKYEDYYARDMQFLPKCRAGAALPGWETYFGKSRGATWEAHTMGVLLKRAVYALPNLSLIPPTRLPQIVI